MNADPKGITEGPGARRKLWFGVFAILTVAVILFSLSSLGRRNSKTVLVGAFVTNGVPTEEAAMRHSINLSPFYNAGTRTNWIGERQAGRSLASLPEGENSLGGVLFEVQGVIQLRGGVLRKNASFFPQAMNGIPLRTKCERLHFLHGTAWSALEGTQIASYNIHFADGSRVDVPVIYGDDVRDWCYLEDDLYKTDKTAWSSKQRGYKQRLYRSVWQNPKPNVPISSIDFVGGYSPSFPFLLGITAE